MALQIVWQGNQGKRISENKEIEKFFLMAIEGVEVKIAEYWCCPLCDRSLRVFETENRQPVPRLDPLKSAWCSVCDLDIWIDFGEENTDQQFVLKDQDITLEEIHRMKKLMAFK